MRRRDNHLKIFLSALALLGVANNAYAQDPAGDTSESKSKPSIPDAGPEDSTSKSPAAEAEKKPSSGDDAAQVINQSEVKEKVDKKVKTTQVKGKISGTGLGIFGGVDLGLIFTAPKSNVYKLVESSQLGFAPIFKFGGSVFTRRIILDAGLGLQYAKYGGTLLALPLPDEFGDIEFRPVNTTYSNSQTAMYIETAGRLRFKEKYQAGLLANVIFSTKTAGFSSVPDLDQTEKYNAFIGPQFVYETTIKNYISRFNASFALSLTSSERSIYVASVGASVGSYIIDPVTVVKTQTERKFKTKVTREVIQLKAQSAEVTDNVSFIFDSQMVNFKLNSSELNPKSEGFINALGEMFARERDLFGKLVIEGHTDSRGSPAYNAKLSATRARAVLGQLEKAGVPRSSMEAAGLGSTQLLVNPEVNEVDYARNRRVEIRILGLKDARAIQKQVEEIQQRFFGKSAETRSVPIPQKSSPDTSSDPKAPPAWDPGLESQDKQ